MTKCWNQDPNLRPTFKEIVSILLIENGFEPLSAEDLLDGICLSSIIRNSLQEWYLEQNEFESMIKETKSKPKKISREKVYYKNIQNINKNIQMRRTYCFAEPPPPPPKTSMISSVISWFKAKFWTSNQQQQNETEILRSNEMFSKDESDEFDKEKAELYYKQAADHGTPDEMKHFAEMLMNSQDQDVKSRSVEIPDHQENDQQQMNETEALNITELLQLGEKFYKGEGVEVDIEKAKQYYKEAADRGNSDAMNNYAWILIHQDSNPSNRQEAMSYFVRAVNQGNMLAMANYLKFIKEDDEEKK